MERKKAYIIAIVAILIITIVSFGIVIINNFTVQKKKQAEEQKKEAAALKLLPKAVCNFSSDNEAREQAFKDKSLEDCSCVKDAQARDLCNKQIVDLQYLGQARQQYDPVLCEKISASETKEHCHNLVSQFLDYLTKNDPKTLASIYTKNNNYDEAIKILELLAGDNGADKNDVKTLLNLALNYAGKGLNDHQENIYVPKALALIDRALAINSNDPEVYRIQGYVNEVKPDLVQALNSYNKSLNIDPNYILSYVGRGHTNNMLGVLEKALEDFKKAATLDKEQKYIAIYSNLCRLESSRTDLMEDAIKNCRIVTKSDDSNGSDKAGAYQSLAGIYEAQGRNDEALTQLQYALALGYKDPNVYVMLARVNLSKKDYISAEKNALDALKIDPMKSLAYNELGHLYFEQNKLDESLVACQKGLDLADKDASLLMPNKFAYKKDFYLLMAESYGKKGDTANEAKYKKLADQN